MTNNPTFTIIAGVNGAGKTTFALDYFADTDIVFINADLIASGLSPNNPDISQFVAGKLMLEKMQEYINNQQSFAIETTLSSKNYLKIILQLKQDNWRIEMLYLYLPSVDLSLQRVAERVKNGGHNIKTADIKRRYDRSMKNLIADYYTAVDEIICLNNDDHNEVIFTKNKEKLTIVEQEIYNKILDYKKC